MQRQLCLQNSEEAVSPIIGTILILGIMVSITGTMLAWGIPQIQESEAYAIYTSAQNNFLNFDDDMDQVILQGEGASRVSTVSFSAGTFVHRSDLDQIRYYYTNVNWSDPKIVGVENGSEEFAILDSKGTVNEFIVNITYPNGTSWQGSSSSRLVNGFPAIVYGSSAIILSKDNSTQIGGFLIFGTDSLSYQYGSVSGVFKMRMFNGGIVSREPGGPFFVSSKPLTRSIGEDGSYEVINFYQTDYNMSLSAKAIMAGNYVFEARNQGGTDNSMPIYSLRMAFDGDSATALKNYYLTNWGFSRTTYYFTSSESSKAASMGFEEDISYTQDSSFDFRVMQRDIHVTFSLR